MACIRWMPDIVGTVLTSLEGHEVASQTIQSNHSNAHARHLEVPLQAQLWCGSSHCRHVSPSYSCILAICDFITSMCIAIIFDGRFGRRAQTFKVDNGGLAITIYQIYRMVGEINLVWLLIIVQDRWTLSVWKSHVMSDHSSHEYLTPVGVGREIHAVAAGRAAVSMAWAEQAHPAASQRVGSLPRGRPVHRFRLARAQ